MKQNQKSQMRFKMKKIMLCIKHIEHLLKGKHKNSYLNHSCLEKMLIKVQGDILFINVLHFGLYIKSLFFFSDLIRIKNLKDRIYLFMYLEH